MSQTWWPNGRWVQARDLYREELPFLESPRFVGSPPPQDPQGSSANRWYFLAHSPFLPIVRWAETVGADGAPATRTLLRTGTTGDLFLDGDLDSLIRTAPSRVAQSGGAASYQEVYHPPRGVTPSQLWGLPKVAAAPVQAVAPPKAFVTGLGADVDALAAKSPRLQAQLKQLTDKGWKLGYGEAGASKTYQKAWKQKAHIDIKPDAQGQPARVVQQLSHEVGHALHPNTPDMSSRQAYIDSQLKGEGWATMNNLAVQKEILAASGTDIGVASAHPRELVPQYQAIYGESLTTGDADGAAQAIGRLYGQHEITGGAKGVPGVPYSDYYGTGYDDLLKH